MDFTTSPTRSCVFVEAHKLKQTSSDFVGPLSDRQTFWSAICQIRRDQKDLKDETENPKFVGEGALHFLTSSHLLVKGCTFTNCVTPRGSGGAIVVHSDQDFRPDQI
ncbi:hypothetical protein BLNAU_16687 [Blattamonas nauphoetae]|uniref:Uncharacterized protein n=1 Tax=Blattamonas nauphoetae TaxID=2049346 RepID=A0ABQ9XDG3_9EUKA|nr:hypothetical protein BLNAU_16687 [Blattamonas nauphoetae]